MNWHLCSYPKDLIIYLYVAVAHNARLTRWFGAAKRRAVQPIVKAYQASTADVADHEQQPEFESHQVSLGKRWIAETREGALYEYLAATRPASLSVSRQSNWLRPQTPLSRHHPIPKLVIRSNQLIPRIRLPLPGEKNNSLDQSSSLSHNILAGNCLH